MLNGEKCASKVTALMGRVRAAESACLNELEAAAARRSALDLKATWLSWQKPWEK